MIPFIANLSSFMYTLAGIVFLFIVGHEALRIMRPGFIEKHTGTTTATVTSIRTINKRKSIMTYRYSPNYIEDMREITEKQTTGEPDTESESEDGPPTYTLEEPFNPTVTDIRWGDELEIKYLPDDPETAWIPALDEPKQPSLRSHVLSQVLRTVIMFELLLLGRML